MQRGRMVAVWRLQARATVLGEAGLEGREEGVDTSGRRPRGLDPPRPAGHTGEPGTPSYTGPGWPLAGAAGQGEDWRTWPGGVGCLSSLHSGSVQSMRAAMPHRLDPSWDTVTVTQDMDSGYLSRDRRN